MDNVVKLDAAAKNKTVRKPRKRQSKTALVLGGGGFTGGVYEIGALRALDLLSVNKSVNQFDVYVGTSVGSVAANGVTPEQMMRVVNNQVPTPFPFIRHDNLLRLNLKGCAFKTLVLPLQLANVAKDLPRNILSLSPVDIATALADALPSG